MRQVLTTALNGLTLGALYFLVASGLTLIFGLMRVINLAHGTLYLLGGYLGFSIVGRTGSWAFGALGAALAVGAIGALVYSGVLRRFQHEELRVALITIGLSVVGADLMRAVYGSGNYRVPAPDQLRTALTLPVVEVTYPGYRLFVLVSAIAVGLGLWLLLNKTRFGMVVRAGVDNRDMVSAMGINVNVVFVAMFFLGTALAGLAGVLGGSTFTLSPGVDNEFLLFSLVVLIIGGMGSVAGAAIASVLVGLVFNFAIGYAAPLATILVFVLLILVLVVRPEGLLGRRERMA